MLDEFFTIEDSRQDFSYSRRDGRHKVIPYRRRAGVVRLDCNAAQWRSSLRLIVQKDVVFILSYNAHGPWNTVEGQRRMMTKEYEVSGECYLGRRAFIVKGNEEDKARRQRVTI